MPDFPSKPVSPTITPGSKIADKRSFGSPGVEVPGVGAGNVESADRSAPLEEHLEHGALPLAKTPASAPAKATVVPGRKESVADLAPVANHHPVPVVQKQEPAAAPKVASAEVPPVRKAGLTAKTDDAKKSEQSASETAAQSLRMTASLSVNELAPAHGSASASAPHEKPKSLLLGTRPHAGISVEVISQGTVTQPAVHAVFANPAVVAIAFPAAIPAALAVGRAHVEGAPPAKDAKAAARELGKDGNAAALSGPVGKEESPRAVGAVTKGNSTSSSALQAKPGLPAPQHLAVQTSHSEASVTPVVEPVHTVAILAPSPVPVGSIVPQRSGDGLPGFDLEAGSTAGGLGMTRTLEASPHALEIGISGSGHGWLRVRAELDDSGVVSASLITSSVASVDSLHKQTEAMALYLKSEAVGLSTLSVTSSSASGTEGRTGAESAMQGTASGGSSGEGRQRQGAENRSADGNAAGGWDGNQDAGLASFMAGVMPAALPSLSTGGWLNVVA